MAAERTLTLYPLGSTATVYFDPADPKIAALERGHSSADYWLLTKALCVLLAVQWLLAGSITQLYHWMNSHIAAPDNAPLITGIACFGLFFLILAIGVTIKLITVWTWPSTDGRIKSSSLDSFHVSEGESYYTAYKPRLLYAYKVDGREYQGDRVFLNFALGGFGEQQSQKIVARYRVKDLVRVFYNPRKPGDSVLIRRVRGILLFWMLASVFMFAV